MERVELMERAVPVGTKLMIDDMHGTGTVRTLFIDKPEHVYPIETVRKVKYRCARCSDEPSTLGELLENGSLVESADERTAP